MTYIGFNVDDKILEKLKVISFMQKKTRTDLIKEGLDMIMEKYAGSFDELQDYIKQMKK